MAFNLAFALKCWDCSSEKDAGCGDPFEKDKVNQTFYVDCLPKSINEKPYCLKAKGKLPIYS